MTEKKIVGAKMKAKEITYPKVELFYDSILTTVKKRSVTKSGIILSDNKGNIETRQTIVAAGPTAGVDVGDDVEIAPERFKVKMKYPKNGIGADIPEIQVPIEIINDVPYLFMSSRELKYKYKR